MEIEKILLPLLCYSIFVLGICCIIFYFYKKNNKKRIINYIP